MASHPTPACCGTSKAAELLQLSVGTVQSLVDKNILKAWVTEGGHRRISLESIRNYQVQQQKLPALERLINDRLRVMVVDDDDQVRAALAARLVAWGAEVDSHASLASVGVAALTLWQAALGPSVNLLRIETAVARRARPPSPPEYPS